ncbi:DUF262 domain-containing protein [archaeon]|jgi:hypothetical protein|nr:DUF262 domain-containing protein [archaeon]
MKYSIQNWRLIDLVNLYKENNLILDPPYQRNFIWSKKDQEELIDSIISKKYPLPSFFLRKLDDDKYEMVDGQQRTRTILAYYKRNFESDKIPEIVNKSKEDFSNYDLSITIIESEEASDLIEDFYARVNKTGRKLNKPELNKAEYFYTEFLSLNQELAGAEEFKSLELFTPASSNRMNDIDFISELITLIEFGPTEKKDKVDVLYEKDIDAEKKEELRHKFKQVLGKIQILNSIFPIQKTRYRQRNDFYTLFNFLIRNEDLTIAEIIYFYKVLILIGSEISPSNDFCIPFKEYAINCVSQSNQKRARLERLKFLESLFLNQSNKPNQIQIEVTKFYKIIDSVQKINNYYTIDLKELMKLKSSITFYEPAN